MPVGVVRLPLPVGVVRLPLPVGVVRLPLPVGVVRLPLLCRQVAGLAAGIVSVLLGLVYLSVSLTRPFSFTWGPGSPMTESALPFAGQLVLGLLAPVAFALGVDQVNDHAAAHRFSHSYPLISRTCATLLGWGTANAEINTDEAGI